MNNDHKPFFPKSILGQNFLIDNNIVEKIVKTAEINDSDIILEIGPGKGILTRRLASSKCKKLYSVELDQRLKPFLDKLDRLYPKLQLIWSDAVKFDYSTMVEDPPNKLIANLPYNITTPLIWALLEKLVPYGLNTFIIMVQKESALRICAPAGTKARYPLGIVIQAMGTARRIMKVSPESFRPVPGVDSVVLKIDLFRNLGLASDPEWKRLIKSGFGQRRKTLAKNLLLSGYCMEKGIIDEILENSGLSHSVRAEELQYDEWLYIYREIMQYR